MLGALGFVWPSSLSLYGDKKGVATLADRYRVAAGETEQCYLSAN